MDWYTVYRARQTCRAVASVLWIALLGVLLATALPVLYLRWASPPTTAFMLQSRARAAWSGRDDYRLRYEWVDWEQISPHAPIAVVAAEDQRFPEHAGFDVEGIADAFLEHKRTGRRRGASTISQQVAKNLFLWSGRNLVRKGLEAYFTLWIELCWPKRRVIEVYLNVAQFGDGIFGVEAASRTFFHKPARRLSAQEAALLAAVLPSPVRLHADRPSDYVRERARWIRDQGDMLGGPAYLQAL